MHGNSPGYEEARGGQVGLLLGEKGLVENAERRTGDVGKVAIPKGEGLRGGEGGDGGDWEGVLGMRISYLPRSP